jgi:replicative DNA helicase Mcm
MDIQDKLDEFLREKYHAEIRKAMHEEHSVVIDFTVLDRYDPIIADQLLEAPKIVLEILNTAATAIADGEKMNVRIKNLPPGRQMRIRSLRSKHIGKLWCVDAIIRSASEVKPQIYEAVFECPDCKAKIIVPQDTNIIQKPGVCECGRRGDFPLVEKKLYDMRWLIGSEPFDITSGEKPGEVNIFLKEDLTTPRMQRKSDPGSRIKVTGLLKELPKRIKGKLSTRMDMYIDANYFEMSDVEFEELEISPEDEKLINEMAHDPDIYEKLKASIAPAIYGYDEIKEAMVLQLFGGVAHMMPDGTRVRGNMHILLTGDPGVGKTQLLKLAASIVPRGRYVSGSGVSGAGLTATVIKNEAIGSWVLEAGALILCNKGLIAIDEFDKMSRDDQIAMHEATSVETVSIAKAGIIATLPAQTSVLAGANPKLGRFDPYKPIGDQIMIPETLLSRFDLKFALRDRPDSVVDEKMAEHIIMSRTNPERIEPIINMNLLRKYIAYSKKITSMELLPESANLIKDFYVQMRGSYGGDETAGVSITLRQYEALIRLAEASAKIRLDTKIRLEDAERAIRLMKYSMMQLGYDFETKRFDVDRMEGGIPSSRRGKARIILSILESMQKEVNEVPVDDLKAEAENQGVSDLDEVIEILKKDGMIFEPRSGFLKKT